VGTAITSVDIYINDVAPEMKLKIWAKGAYTVPGPGELLFEQAFTASATSWNTVELNEPFLLNGETVWVGYSYFQPASTFVAGFDIGPADPNGSWVSSGVGWFQLADAGLDGNWNIIARTTGDPIPTFMDVPVDAGLIIPGGSETVGVFFDPTDLSAGLHTGQLVIAANDPAANYHYIDVTLDIVTATNEVNKTDALTVYPNPTSNLIHVQADGIISEVVVTNYLGQVVDVQTLSNNQTTVDLSQLENGVYFLEVKTDAANHSVKVVKK
jgi:hypothetical protein